SLSDLFLLFFFLLLRRQPISTLFPYTTLFRSSIKASIDYLASIGNQVGNFSQYDVTAYSGRRRDLKAALHWIEDYEQTLSHAMRSEEHTSELQSPCNLVCRLLLEKKKITNTSN